MKVSVPDIGGDEDTGDDDGHSETSPCCFHCNTESNKESSDALPRNGGNAKDEILLTIVHSSPILNIILILSQQ